MKILADATVAGLMQRVKKELHAAHGTWHHPKGLSTPLPCRNVTWAWTIYHVRPLNTSNFDTWRVC